MRNSFTVFLIGLSGSGKTTLAKEVIHDLHYADLVHLDGDVLRSGLNKDLSFSKKDRDENIRRVIEISKLMNDNGKSVIGTFIMPYDKMRQFAKERISRCYIVYINTSIFICKARDPKGLYKKVEEGLIQNFTGITDPFEEPTLKTCDLAINAGELSLEESTAILKAYLHHWSCCE